MPDRKPTVHNLLYAFCDKIRLRQLLVLLGNVKVMGYLFQIRHESALTHEALDRGRLIRQISIQFRIITSVERKKKDPDAPTRAE